MAVTDFGAGRYEESHTRPRRAYAYQHQAQDYDDFDGYYDEDDAHYDVAPDGVGARLARLTHYLGALVSVALIVGLTVWGYRLVMRDVSGVPVIRAMEGQSRIAPDDPGGVLADNGGLSVNDVAAGAGAVRSDRVAIAPDATGLAEDDLAMGALAQPELIPVDEYKATLPPEDSALADAGDTLDAPLSEDVAPELAAGFAEAPLDEAGPGDDAVIAALAEAQEEPDVSPVQPKPVVAASRRPAPRPRSVAQAARSRPAAASRPAEAVATAEAAPAAKPEAEEPRIAAAAPSSGAPLVQIGAFDSGTIADSEWGRISGRFNALFAGKSQLVQKTQRNGRTFYRLRVAGFSSRDDARRFCAALIAEGTDCIPATAK